MMPSEFKDSFENFMNSSLTIALDPFLQLSSETSKGPIIFEKVVRNVFGAYYSNVENKLEGILSKIG